MNIHEKINKSIDLNIIGTANLVFSEKNKKIIFFVAMFIQELKYKRDPLLP